MTNSSPIAVVRLATVLWMLSALGPRQVQAETSDLTVTEVQASDRREMPEELKEQWEGRRPTGLAGAFWSLSISSDSKQLTAIYISGSYATVTGTTRECPLVPNYAARVSLDGNVLWFRNSNKFDVIFLSDNRCGFYVTVPATMSVLDPGTYQAITEQPAYGAPVTASVVVPACKTKKPLFQINFPADTDHFYTISASARSGAISTLGGVDQGIAANLEGEPLAGTLPFSRYYQYLPVTDHFYTTVPAERSYVLSHGWQYENNEGYIYTAQKPGTVPFYRLSRYNANTGDHDHLYTRDAAMLDYYVKWESWGYDTIAGYVCP